MFNQNKHVAFPTEGNSLLREVRLYSDKKSAKNASGRDIQRQITEEVFAIKSNTEIVEVIDKAINNSNLPDYNERIRIVDNEGVIIRAVTDMLCKLNDLVDNDITESINQQEYDNYNAKAKSLNIKIDDRSLVVKHYQEVNANNLSNCFHLHAARYLYMVFDLKPLEKRVFAAMQKNDTNIVIVYPSATGARTAQYSLQDGRNYRELEVNRATGYNDKAKFLSEMESGKLKDLLIEKIVMHICYSLIPYTGLRTGYKTIDEQEKMNIEGEVKDEWAGMNKIFSSFIQLVAQDYHNAQYIDNMGVSTKLDKAWIEKVEAKYKAVCQESFSDISNVSSEPAKTNYSFRF